MIQYTTRLTHPAFLVFDPVDVFARDSGLRGEKPRPISALRFDLLRREVGGNWEPFPASLKTVENSSGYHLFFGQTRRPKARRDQPAPRLTLAAGLYEVRVTAAHYQPRTIRARVTAPDRPVEVPVNLLPAYDYPFPSGLTAGGLPGPTLLRGSLRRADGTMIDSAVVGVRFPFPVPQPPPGEPAVVPTDLTCVTDAAGQWVLPIPDPPRPSPDDPPPTDLGVLVRAGFDGRVIVLLNGRIPHGTTTSIGQGGLRGRVVRPGGRPAAGVTITAAPEGNAAFPGQSRSQADGAWVYYLPPEVRLAVRVVVTATAPDGGSAAVVTTVQAGQHRPIPDLVLDR